MTGGKIRELSRICQAVCGQGADVGEDFVRAHVVAALEVFVCFCGVGVVFHGVDGPVVELPAEAADDGFLVGGALEVGLVAGAGVAEEDFEDAPEVAAFVVCDVGEFMAYDADLGVEGDFVQGDAVEVGVVVDEYEVAALAEEGADDGPGGHGGLFVGVSELDACVFEFGVVGEGEEGLVEVFAGDGLVVAVEGKEAVGGCAVEGAEGPVAGVAAD